MFRRWIALTITLGLAALMAAGLAAWSRHVRPGPASAGDTPEEVAARWLASVEGLTVLRVLHVKPPGFPEQLLLLAAEELYPNRSAEDRSRPTNHFPRGGPAHVGYFAQPPMRSRLYLVDPEDPLQPRRLSPSPSYNVWEMSQGDVDGDGVQEIGACTWSRTVLEPEMDYRFFVYGWTANGDLVPRFRGSRLSRPLVAAVLRDVDGDGRAELLSVEKGRDGGEVVVAYDWNQFGFRGIGESAVYPGVCLADDATTGGRQRSFRVSLQGPDERWRSGWLVWREGSGTMAEVKRGWLGRALTSHERREEPAVRAARLQQGDGYEGGFDDATGTR